LDAAFGPPRIFGREFDDGALLKCHGDSLDEAEVQLAYEGGVPRCDLYVRTAPEHEITASGPRDGDRVEAIGGHVFFEQSESGVVTY
jgi:hypothetical protein